MYQITMKCNQCDISLGPHCKQCKGKFKVGHKVVCAVDVMCAGEGSCGERLHFCCNGCFKAYFHESGWLDDGEVEKW